MIWFEGFVESWEFYKCLLPFFLLHLFPYLQISSVVSHVRVFFSLSLTEGLWLSLLTQQRIKDLRLKGSCGQLWWNLQLSLEYQKVFSPERDSWSVTFIITEKRCVGPAVIIQKTNILYLKQKAELCLERLLSSLQQWTGFWTNQ